MSFKALAWAVEREVPHAADKLVLLGLADRHNEEAGAAYPSIEWLTRFGSLDRKTVITALQRLEASGLIGDTGRRTGRTKQVKLYALALDGKSIPKTEPLGEAEKQSQKRNSSVFSPKQSQKRDTEPVKEPSTSEAKASSVPRMKGKQIEDNWRPEIDPSSETAKETGAWPPEFLAREIERFIGHHQSKGTVSKNWNRQWATWALGPYARQALKEWNSERSNGSELGSSFRRAAAARIARERAGASAS